MNLFNVQVLPDQVDEVIFGCVLSAGIEGPARQAMRKASVPDHVGASYH